MRAALASDEVAVLTGGTGNPIFTTDTAACLRGLELNVDTVLKATKVDGVLTADPMIDAGCRALYGTGFRGSLGPRA